MNPATPECRRHSAEPRYATVTVLTFTDAQAKHRALAALADLIAAANDLPGFERCQVMDSGPTQAIMITLYASRSAAEEASAAVRPHLGAAIGSHVAEAPQRWAGQLVLDSGLEVRG
jgi:hypothetical protein